MLQRPVRMKNVVITQMVVCIGLLISQLSSAMEAFVGSDADGVRTLYKISFTGSDDVALEPSVQFSRAVGLYETEMIALRPDKPACYLFIGSQIVTYNLETNALERRRLPGREVEYFTAPAFFSPTGRFLYTFSVGVEGAQGLVLNSDTLEVVAELPYRGNTGSVYAVAFAPDESALCVARDNSIVRYAIPPDGAGGLVFQAEQGTLVTDLSAFSTEMTSRLYLQDERLLAIKHVSHSAGSSRDDGATTLLIRASGSNSSHLELNGVYLPGSERDSPLCSFDPRSEAIYVYDADRTVRDKISVVFTELLTADEVEVAFDDTGKAFKKLVGVRAYGTRSPGFQTGYRSPDGRFAAMVFDNGVRGPSYVSMVDISAGTVSPAVRVGEVDGGISNVVFRNSAE